MNQLSVTDRGLSNAMPAERKRKRETLAMIASENYASESVLVLVAVSEAQNRVAICGRNASIEPIVAAINTLVTGFLFFAEGSPTPSILLWCGTIPPTTRNGITQHRAHQHVSRRLPRSPIATLRLTLTIGERCRPAATGVITEHED